jgi:hypothetical protein
MIFSWADWEDSMSAKSSELMMGLLQELAMLKELDKKYESGGRSEVDTAEFGGRQRRRQEISDQMKALA